MVLTCSHSCSHCVLTKAVCVRAEKREAKKMAKETAAKKDQEEKKAKEEKTMTAMKHAIQAQEKKVAAANKANEERLTAWDKAWEEKVAATKKANKERETAENKAREAANKAKEERPLRQKTNSTVCRQQYQENYHNGPQEMPIVVPMNDAMLGIIGPLREGLFCDTYMLQV